MRRELGLTPREMEILRLVTERRGNRELAAELFISAKTARVHVSNVISKLGVANRGGSGRGGAPARGLSQGRFKIV